MKLSVPDPKIMDKTQEMPFLEVNKIANKMARAILNEYPVKRNSGGKRPPFINFNHEVSSRD